MLRPLAASETQAAAALWHDGWRIGHLDVVPEGLVKFRDVDQFHDRIMKSLPDCFVYETASQIMGFVRLKGSELDQFFVHPDQIGKGVAAAQMRAAEGLLQNRGVSLAHLIVSRGNDRAVRFYEKHGWRNAGAQRAGVETVVGPFEMDVIRFEKLLS